MQARLFESFVAAGAVDHVTIYRDPSASGWSLHAYGDEGASLGVNAIEAARGGVRTWASLDTVFSFARECGWSGPVAIDG